MPFVHVKATGECDDRSTTKRADNQLPCVSRNRGGREAWHVRKRNANRSIDAIGKPAEP